MPRKKREEIINFPEVASDEQPKQLDIYTVVIGDVSQASFDEMMIKLSPSAPTFQMWQSFVKDGGILIKLLKA